ncbi:MAG: four helix bundle protein [Thermoguttaceae bacterium]|nr:four helix bundle protein [Thermoguttaceae bacterium]
MNDSRENLIEQKSRQFAIRIINLYKYLLKEKKEFVLSKQLVRSGTSIGANIKEAIRAQSRPDFLSKMNIALKEAAETEYWLDLLQATDFLTRPQYESLQPDIEEILRIISKIVHTTRDTE